MKRKNKPKPPKFRRLNAPTTKVFKDRRRKLLEEVKRYNDEGFYTYADEE